jgi:hypothetical protein
VAAVLPVALRAAEQGDLPLLYSSWVRSLGAKAPWSALDSNYHAASAHALLERLLARPDTVAKVACHPDHHDQVFGVLVADPSRSVMHWIYVRYNFRRARVASRLYQATFGKDPVRASIRTPHLKRLQGTRAIDYDSHQLCEVVAHAA